MSVTEEGVGHMGLRVCALHLRCGDRSWVLSECLLPYERHLQPSPPKARRKTTQLSPPELRQAQGASTPALACEVHSGSGRRLWPRALPAPARCISWLQPGTPQSRVACWVKEVAGNEARARSSARKTRSQPTKTQVPSSPPARSQAAQGEGGVWAPSPPPQAAGQPSVNIITLPRI